MVLRGSADDEVGGAPAGLVTDYPDDVSIAVLFQRWARRTPGAVAVSSGAEQLTYAELDRWSDRLAARLVAARVTAGVPVAVLGERCLEAPVAMLGILKAGAAYVPMNRSDPVDRLQVLVRELAIRHVVTLPGLTPMLPGAAEFAVTDVAGASDPGSPPLVGGGDLAYVMFTSGSTGVPKAVAVPHRAVARLVINTDYLDVRPVDRMSNTGHLAFDASVFEIWGALLNGARVVVVNQDALLDPAALEEVLRSAEISVAWLSAGIFHQCARSRPAMFGGLRCLISGGDVLIPDLVRRVLDNGPPAQLINGYGPTENTTFSTAYRILDVPLGAQRIPIGRPIANSTCQILTADGAPAPVGRTGELWVGGDGMALGYLNDPELTADRFVPDPGGRRPGARLFRTGDMARWLPDGTIDFLGRRDRMVKHRDFRIELGEVEAALAGAPGVLDAAVVVAGSDAQTRTILGFYVSALPSTPRSPADLRRFLADRLPHYMLPARLTAVDEFPLTASGKVDRSALARAAAPGGTAPGLRPPRLPVSPVQIGVARLWAEVLDVQSVGLDDSFFELGGNSLLAARIFARLQESFGVGPDRGRFLTSRLLADPSLAASAEAVEQARADTRRRSDTGPDIDFRREVASNTIAAVTELGDIDDDPLSGDVLMTGASGFVGSHLLRRLLTVTTGRIHCLVRAVDRRHALRRLDAAQARYRLGALPPDRVVPLVGDLAEPRLGLRSKDYDRLADRVGLIMHAGAYVNFTYPYAHLAKVTVAGTREIIQLALYRRRKPVHFVSTMAVLAGFGAAGVREVTEDTVLAFPEHLYMGYAETKWVAEGLLAAAAHVGLPVSVHRPYEVSGDLVHGAWNLENATCALFRLIVDTGVVPDVDLPLDLVPVDVLAAQITHIAVTRPADTATYHLTNPRPAALADMVGALREHGYRIRFTSFEEWVADTVAYVCAHPDHPFTPFVPLWVDRSPRSGLVLKQMYFASYFPRFTRHHAEAALTGSGLTMPPVDGALLSKYIAYFQRRGFLPPASGPTPRHFLR